MIVAVLAVPTDPPVTIPVEPILDIPGALLLHIPPPVASVSEVVKPEHTEVVPNMPVGNGFTVTMVVMLQPVPMV